MDVTKATQPRSRRPGRPDPRAGRAAVVWLVTLFAATQVALLGGIEAPTAGLRDPEYAAKLNRLRARMAEHPGRPLRLAVGSSRVFMGLRVAALRDYPADGEPLVFNFGAIGAGPAMQALAFDRLLRDGIRPAGVLVEYWPPYWLDYAPLHEDARLDATTLARTDLPVATGNARDPAGVAARWRDTRLTPGYGHRFVIMSLAVPTWLTLAKRVDYKWRSVDVWGWKPACEGPQRPEDRALRLGIVRRYYDPCLAVEDVDSFAEKAFDGLVAAAQRAGCDVTAIWMPESSQFRALYPPPRQAWATAYFAGLAGRLGVRLIDARTWVADEQFYDGFHLAPDGAATFTERLRREGW